MAEINKPNPASPVRIQQRELRVVVDRCWRHSVQVQPVTSRHRAALKVPGRQDQPAAAIDAANIPKRQHRWRSGAIAHHVLRRIGGRISRAGEAGGA